MKNRTTMVLMEQLVMLLVLAMAAAVCLQLFVAADKISNATRQQDSAVLLAQSGAEVIKAQKGDLEKTAQMLGGITDGSTVTVDEEALRLEITLLPKEERFLGKASLQVRQTQTDSVIFSLTTGWQEVGE